MYLKKISLMLLAMVFLGSSVFAQPAQVELTVEDCVIMALDKNAAVKIAETGITKARGQLYEARGALLPAIDASHTASWTREYDQYGNKRNFNNQVGLNWTIYTGGQAEGTISQGKLLVENAGEDYRVARQSTKLNAQEAYYGFLQAINLNELNQESVERLEAHLENVMAKYRVGMVAKTDVLRSEVELANSTQELIKARNNEEVSMSTLNNVINLPIDTQVKPKGELEYQVFEEDMQSAIIYALENRPEVLRDQTSVAIAKKGISIARANQHPNIILSGAQNWLNSIYPGDDDKGWSAGVTLTFNVFDSGVTQAKVMQKKAELVAAEEISRQTVDNVILEVKTAYLNMLEAEKRIYTSAVAVEQAEEDYRIAGLQYNAGVSTILDILDSQVALTQAKTNHVNALYDFNMSKARLNRAMGIDP